MRQIRRGLCTRMSMLRALAAAAAEACFLVFSENSFKY
jgi:hypothetical protein